MFRTCVVQYRSPGGIAGRQSANRVDRALDVGQVVGQCVGGKLPHQMQALLGHPFELTQGHALRLDPGLLGRRCVALP